MPDLNLIIRILNISPILMRRLITLFFLVFVLSGVAMAQQMSDDQVIQYVKEANKSGKSQKQISTELLRRGVTKEQVTRIQQKYSGNKATEKSTDVSTQLRQRTLVDGNVSRRGTSVADLSGPEFSDDSFELKPDSDAIAKILLLRYLVMIYLLTEI